MAIVQDSTGFLAKLLTVENVVMLLVYTAVLAGNWASLSAKVAAAELEAKRANDSTRQILTKLETQTRYDAELGNRLTAIETDLSWIRRELEN